MALARIGAKRINSYDDSSDTKNEAVQVRLHYTQTAKALMRSYIWSFAKHRVQLSQTDTPDFQWDYAYLLPNDYLRPIGIYTGSDLRDNLTYESWEIEGSKILTGQSTVYLKYVRWISDVPSWDPLFTEVFILQLARKLVIPLSQDVAKMKQDVDKDLLQLLPQVRAMQRQEEMHIGRDDLKTWREARYSDIA